MPIIYGKPTNGTKSVVLLPKPTSFVPPANQMTFAFMAPAKATPPASKPLWPKPGK